MTTGIPDTSHADTHSASGIDPITPDSIGAASDSDLPVPKVAVPRLNCNPTNYSVLSNYQFATSDVSVAPVSSTFPILFSPFFCPATVSVNQIRAKVGGAGVVANHDVSLGLYSMESSTNFPLTRLINEDITVPTGSQNAFIFNSVNVTIPRGFYWMAFLNRNTTTAINMASGGPYNRVFHELIGQTWNATSFAPVALSALVSTPELPLSMAGYILDFSSGNPVVNTNYKIRTSSPIMYLAYD
jgi:hypothetical protein